MEYCGSLPLANPRFVERIQVSVLPGHAKLTRTGGNPATARTVTQEPEVPQRILRDVQLDPGALIHRTKEYPAGWQIRALGWFEQNRNAGGRMNTASQDLTARQADRSTQTAPRWSMMVRNGA